MLQLPLTGRCEDRTFEQWLSNKSAIKCEWSVTKDVLADSERYRATIDDLKKQIKNVDLVGDDYVNRVNFLKTSLQATEEMARGYVEKRHISLWYENSLRWKVDVVYDHIGSALGITKIAFGNGVVLTEDRGKRRYTITDNAVSDLANELIGVPDLYVADLCIKEGNQFAKTIAHAIGKNSAYKVSAEDQNALITFSPQGAVEKLIFKNGDVLDKTIDAKGHNQTVLEAYSYLTSLKIFSEIWKLDVDREIPLSDFKKALAIKVNQDYSLDIKTKTREENGLPASALTVGDFKIEVQ